MTLQHGNHRGIGYSNSVSCLIYLNGVLTTTMSTLTQDVTSGNYQCLYTPSQAYIRHKIEFYVNAVKMKEFFEFDCIPSYIHALMTSVTFLGYMGYQENDCLFVNRPFYIVYDMKDIYGNAIRYHDISAHKDQIYATLTPGLLEYYGSQCYKYLNFQNIIICPYKPLAVGSGQSLDIKDRYGISFTGFPINIQVKPFKQQKFLTDGSNAFAKNFNDISIDKKEIVISFQTVDVYGNSIQDESMCSFYNHNRYQIYFNVIYLALDKITSVYDIEMTPTESFDTLTQIKTFTITVDHLISPLIFSSIQLNYTLIDGLLFSNGIYGKYYTNNNNLGKPLLTSKIDESYIDGSDIVSHWYRMHQDFKDFSVKLTALIKADYTENYSFITGFTNSFELLIDDKFVIIQGQTSGSIALTAKKLYKLTILYRYHANTGLIGTPNFVLQWQSSSMSLRNIDKGNTIAIDIDDREEQILIRDIYQAA